MIKHSLHVSRHRERGNRREHHRINFQIIFSTDSRTLFINEVSMRNYLPGETSSAFKSKRVVYNTNFHQETENKLAVPAIGSTAGGCTTGAMT